MSREDKQIGDLAGPEIPAEAATRHVISRDIAYYRPSAGRWYVIVLHLPTDAATSYHLVKETQFHEVGELKDPPSCLDAGSAWTLAGGLLRLPPPQQVTTPHAPQTAAVGRLSLDPGCFVAK